MGRELDTSKTTIAEFLKENKIICDGAFGTFFSMIDEGQEFPEAANISNPEKVYKVHKEYVDAGAMLIRTNTFASNTVILNTCIKNLKKNIKAACEAAFKAAENKAYVAGDIGPIPYENVAIKPRIENEYIEICKTFIECNVPVIVFETFPDIDDILPAIEYVKANSDIFIITQFSVTQFGFSSAGLSAHKLFELANDTKGIDALGFNCGVGPGHMHQIMADMDLSTDKYLTALPNAGYPQSISNRMIFANDNVDYFVSKVDDLARLGVDIIGGCCGTTPKYIKHLKEKVSLDNTSSHNRKKKESSDRINVVDNSFFKEKKPGKKLIAVELAPPLGSDDKKLMDAACILENSGVDVVTFPDSPSGRTRADSILMAEKVAKKTNLCVMPHLCCRDKNAIAIRSQLLGAHINNINNFLVITGDPIPVIVRQSVKAVFNFDSTGLMNIIENMNEEQFADSPVVYGGAINQNRLNLDYEIKRVKKKQTCGASFFMTQPVFDIEGAKRIKRIKDETNARILCGVMPFVSLKNAVFMKNEMTGIDVPDDIIARYKSDFTKEEGEQTGIEIAREVIEMTKDFVDGYYFSFPFNRVYMLDKILKQTEVL